MIEVFYFRILSDMISFKRDVFLPSQQHFADQHQNQFLFFYKNKSLTVFIIFQKNIKLVQVLKSLIISDSIFLLSRIKLVQELRKQKFFKEKRTTVIYQYFDKIKCLLSEDAFSIYHFKTKSFVDFSLYIDGFSNLKKIDIFPFRPAINNLPMGGIMRYMQYAHRFILFINSLIYF